MEATGADPAAAPTEGAPSPPQPFASVPSFELNPGTVEDLHKQCQGVFPMFFEGAKLLINKGLSNNFQVSHTLTLSSTQPSGYRFGATYVGEKMLGPTEAYPLLLADVDPSGNLNANIVHAVTDRLRCKIITQIQQSKWQSAQFTSDYKADLYTASLTLGNPDVIHGTGVAVAHFLRSITKKLALGAELAYQASPQLPGNHIAVVSFAARYASDEHTLAATLGNTGGLHATYYQKCGENLQIGVELETNFKMQESCATIGYEADLGKGDFVMRAALDTNGIVRSVIEKKLLPLPFTLALCSMINHRKGNYQFGCGLIVG